MNDIRCVVCGAVTSLEHGRYANSWEASLRQHPCCSEQCAQSFGPDEHWMPAAPPVPLDDTDADRLLRAGKVRVREGDGPTMVARDLLIAGVPPWMIRNMLAGEGIAAAKVRSEGRLLSVMTGLGGRLWGTSDKRDSRQVADAYQTIGEWLSHFGE